jgi:hypothetical protein
MAVVMEACVVRETRIRQGREEGRGQIMPTEIEQLREENVLWKAEYQRVLAITKTQNAKMNEFGGEIGRLKGKLSLLKDLKKFQDDIVPQWGALIRTSSEFLHLEDKEDEEE